MCSAICPASRFACHATCRCRCVFCCAVCVRGNLLLLSTRQRSKLLMLRIGAGALLVPRLPCLRVQLHEVPLSTPRSCRRPAVPTMCVYDAMHQSCAPTSTVQSNACPTKHAMYACMHATAGTTWNIRAGLNIWIAVDVFFFFCALYRLGTLRPARSRQHRFWRRQHRSACHTRHRTDGVRHGNTAY